MEDMCRLCLSISNESLQKFSEDHNIALRIQSCFSIKIEYNQLLPNQICKLCINKLNEAWEFQRKIMENENLFLEHLKHENGLNNLLFKIKNEFNVKQDSFKSSENKENTLINDSNVSFGTNDELKHEIDDIAEQTYTSDDEMLSVLKQDNIKSEIIKKHETNLVTETYKCLTCFQILDTQINLINHYKLVHFNVKDCDKKTEYTTQISDNYNIYKCNVCSKEYRSKKNMHRHLIVHSNLRPYICKMCGRTYKTASEIVRHGRVHSETKLFCSYQCGYNTVYLGALRVHEKRHDKSDYKYKCEKCNKGFEVKTWYDQHQNVHNGLKPYVCDVCGLAFHMDRYLTAHRSAVHPQSSNIKRYVCVHCTLPCDSKKALTEHLAVHGVKTSFLCDLCGKTLSNAEQLKSHKKRHLGEKPYTCSTCHKSFTKKFNLKVHQRTHTGERAYACARCGRRYTQRSTLVRHYARHHPGTEPVDCVKCQKHLPCISKQQLKIHRKNCKGGECSPFKD